MIVSVKFFKEIFVGGFPSLSRQGFVFLPLIFIMTYFGGLTGLALTQPLSDIITFIISVPLGLKALNGINTEAKTHKKN